MTQPCTHEELPVAEPRPAPSSSLPGRRPHLVVLPDVPDAPAGPPLPVQVDRARWAAAWEHRPLLLGLARQRLEVHAAEDVVSEAMLRAATTHQLRDEALRPWLVTTTLRLCADDHRRVQRDRRRDLRLAVIEPTTERAVDEDVVDQLHARWLAAQLQRLPERQAQALWLRAAGHDVASIATAMRLPYKTVESLLSRGRSSIRGWAGAVVLVFGAWRSIAKRKAQFHVAAATLGATSDLTYEVARAATGFLTRSF